MKYIKGFFLTLIILIIVAILLRGPIFRSLITYDSIGERENYLITDDNLAYYIDSGAESLLDPNVEQIIKLSLSLTSNQLNFTFEKNDNDPNLLIISKTAHCVGYAHFFATTCNYLLEKHGFSADWLATSRVGQMSFIGIDVHQFFNSPFFRDHDFVVIENLKTGEKFAVDPSVHDYLGIDFISYRK